MDRRAFLAVGGRTLALAAGPSGLDRLTPLVAPHQLPDELEARVAAVLQAYDAQGNHRTGTEVDVRSAEWLASQVRCLGVRPTLEPFDLGRVDPRSSHLRVGDRRVDGVPLFDASFTGPEGLRGALGPLGSGSDIGLAETKPSKLSDSVVERRDQLAEAQQSRHKAVVLLTGGSRPGLFLLNAESFLSPIGPPMLQVSSGAGDWLRREAERRADVTIVVHAQRTPARAFNVTARIAGRDPKLAPIVFMAPRSGWWQCASEQGSRLVCWLEVMRALAAARPVRDCLFVALSGHELGLLGIHPYLKRRPELPRRAHAWIFFGSSLGEPGQPNQIYAADETLERWLVASLTKEGLSVDARIPRGAAARGEAGIVQQAGGRVVTIAGGSDVYHNVADRWPEAVGVASLARYARALASGAVDLAQGRP